MTTDTHILKWEDGHQFSLPVGSGAGAWRNIRCRHAQNALVSLGFGGIGFVWFFVIEALRRRRDESRRGTLRACATKEWATGESGAFTWTLPVHSLRPRTSPGLLTQSDDTGGGPCRIRTYDRRIMSPQL